MVRWKLIFIILILSFVANSNQSTESDGETPHITASSESTTTTTTVAARTLPLPTPSGESTTTVVLNYECLPKSGDTFQKIRDGRKIFVDKSRFLEYILDGSTTYYFMTRPRQFGKSMFLGMIASFFAGEKYRFENLTVSDRGNSEVRRGDWVPYPVIQLDFTELTLRDCFSLKQFAKQFTGRLLDIAEGFNLTYSRSNFRLVKMIEDLRRMPKFENRRVIILIDEYDHPILYFLREDDKKLAEAIKRYLNAFFAEIKARGDDLKLVFVTGVSRLPSQNVGFGVNIFTDITRDKRFYDAMGIRKSELNQRDLKPFLNGVGKCQGLMMDEKECEEMVRKQLETLPKGQDDEKLLKEQCRQKVKEDRRMLLTSLYDWYNGYSFVPKMASAKMLNPYSVFECFRKGELASTWMYDEGLAEVVERMVNENLPWDYYENYTTTGREIFGTFDMLKDTLPLPVEMFSQGFLTIQSYDEATDELILNYPNRDIRNALETRRQRMDDKNFTANYAKRYPVNENFRLLQAFTEGDMNKVVENINHHFFSIDVPLHDVNEDALTVMLIYYLKMNRVGVKGTFYMKNIREDAGDLDLQTTGLNINYLIEIKRTGDGDMDAIRKFSSYVNLKSFRDGIDNQGKMFLLGLTFNRCKGQERKVQIVSWVLLPYEYTSLNDANPTKNLKFDRLECSNPAVKNLVAKEMKNLLN